MQSKHKSRLDTLETKSQSQAQRVLGIRIFDQNPNNPAVFHPVNGDRWGDYSEICVQADIDALSAQGWQCIKVVRPIEKA